ncbi:hypothetical protein B296_00026689, partial [Ensete ventricosum]
LLLLSWYPSPVCFCVTFRLSMELPKIEVRFEDVSVETEVYVRRSVLPTLPNAIINTAQVDCMASELHNLSLAFATSNMPPMEVMGWMKLYHSQKKPVKILDDLRGIIRPSREKITQEKMKGTLWSTIFSRYLMLIPKSNKILNCNLDSFSSEKTEDGESTNNTVGKTILKSRGMLTESHWYWYSVAILLMFAVVFNIFSILALEYLKGLYHFHSFIFKCIFVCYQLKKFGIKEKRLQLLKGVSGAFRPGVLTALMGVTGAGKTTLLDVLAGRKTVGHIEGSINISGYPKKQETFARVSGYCEQVDNHSLCLTVFESLWYSAWLRLPSQVDVQTINVCCSKTKICYTFIA